MTDANIEKPKCTYDRERAFQLWTREDDLINYRLTWLGVVQGLMSAGYGVVLNDTNCRERCVAVKSLIPYSGMWLNALIFVGILAAMAATIVIYCRTDDPQKRFGITFVTTLSGWICALGIPLVFGCFWYWLYTLGPGAMTGSAN